MWYYKILLSFFITLCYQLTVVSDEWKSAVLKLDYNTSLFNAFNNTSTTILIFWHNLSTQNQQRLIHKTINHYKLSIDKKHTTSIRNNFFIRHSNNRSCKIIASYDSIIYICHSITTLYWYYSKLYLQSLFVMMYVDFNAIRYPLCDLSNSEFSSSITL